MKRYGTILYAEDDPRDIELTFEALTEHQLANNVVVVHDGVAVLNYLRSEGEYAGRPPGHPVVILMDIKMPRMDGLETLRAIRTDPALKMIPVVIMTSSHEKTDLKASYEVGVNAYVVKPVDLEKFIEAVKHLSVFWALINEPPPFEE